MISYQRVRLGWFGWLAMVSMLVVFGAACAASAGAQQPNHYRAALLLNGGGVATTGPIPSWGAPAAAPGPYVVQLPAAGATPSLWVAGGFGLYFEVWACQAPPLGSGFVAQGGLCDLDPGATWTRVLQGTLPGLVGDDGQSFWGAPVPLGSSPQSATAQGWVVDPTRTDGVRLTGCIHAWN